MYDAIILGISQVRRRFNQPKYDQSVTGSDNTAVMVKGSRNNAVIDLLPHYLIFVN